MISGQRQGILTSRSYMLSEIKREKIDVIVNCAYTNVDAAEDTLL